MSTLKTIIKEHITYRKQIFKLAKANLEKTYRGSALGWAWAIIKPVVTVFVFWFAFSVGLRTGGDVNGYPYFLWLVSGFIPWFYMQEMINGGAACIRNHKFMVTKMKFPISVIPTFVSLSKLSVNIILTVMMIILFMIFGYMPDVYYLQILLYMLMMFPAIVVAVVTGALMLRDAAEISSPLTVTWMTLGAMALLAAGAVLLKKLVNTLLTCPSFNEKGVRAGLYLPWENVRFGYVHRYRRMSGMFLLSQPLEAVKGRGAPPVQCLSMPDTTTMLLAYLNYCPHASQSMDF